MTTPTTQMGFFFDQSRCSGCYTCILACKQWQNWLREPANWRWVVILEKGVFPNVRVNFLSLACCHCAKPACIDVCPGNAIQKREEDGIVVVDRKKCWGRDACGGRCYDACPYGAPQFGKEENAKMEKCDYCIDRLYKGKTPICVSCCPCRALDAGSLEELRRRYGDFQEAKGFVYHSEVKPSVIFRRKLSSSG